ncbi:MAG: hypothetical protein L6Q80_10255 [Dehalococcoidia bacterium]|nr:hypothetical protein [Dehalococcoidia bacterium]
MPERANVFAIHSWHEADLCRRLEDLLRGADQGLAHYSVLPERALAGSPDEVARQIAHRISVATAVLVVNTPGLHRRPTAGLEMQMAVNMDKRIVVVQPHGAFDQPVPQVLDGHVYRYATWRSDVVGRAIRGEYPQDCRVFDIAEVADRRTLVAALSAGIAVASFVVIIATASAFTALQRDLATQGVDVRWDDHDSSRKVLAHTLIGGAIGGFLGALSGDGKTALAVAAGGAAIGAALGVHRAYSARFIGAANRKVLFMEPLSP